MRRNSFFVLMFGLFNMFNQGCTSAKTPQDNFPSQAKYSNYDLIDARHTQTISLKVKPNTKIAVVVRDLSLTSYNNLEKPTYQKNKVVFEGTDRCCAPEDGKLGSSGLLVYRFSFLQKGETLIKLIARHKGQSPTAEHLDDDLVTTVRVNVE